MKITRELLKEWGACYYDEEDGKEKVNDLIPPEGLTLLEVLALDIPLEDRLWVLLRLEVIPAKELRLLACDFADQALALVDNPDPRSVEAVAVSRRYAVGEASASELQAARHASRSAAWDAAWHAAWYAGSAAGSAAWDAARYAAWYAAEGRQIEMVRKVLEELE